MSEFANSYMPDAVLVRRSGTWIEQNYAQESLDVYGGDEVYVGYLSSGINMIIPIIAGGGGVSGDIRYRMSLSPTNPMVKALPGDVAAPQWRKFKNAWNLSAREKGEADNTFNFSNTRPIVLDPSKMATWHDAARLTDLEPDAPPPAEFMGELAELGDAEPPMYWVKIMVPSGGFAGKVEAIHITPVEAYTSALNVYKVMQVAQFAFPSVSQGTNVRARTAQPVDPNLQALIDARQFTHNTRPDVELIRRLILDKQAELENEVGYRWRPGYAVQSFALNKQDRQFCSNRPAYYLTRAVRFNGNVWEPVEIGREHDGRVYLNPDTGVIYYNHALFGGDAAAGAVTPRRYGNRFKNGLKVSYLYGADASHKLFGVARQAVEKLVQIDIFKNLDSNQIAPNEALSNSFQSKVHALKREVDELKDSLRTPVLAV